MSEHINNKFLTFTEKQEDLVLCHIRTLKIGVVNNSDRSIMFKHKLCREL